MKKILNKLLFSVISSLLIMAPDASSAEGNESAVVFDEDIQAYLNSLDKEDGSKITSITVRIQPGEEQEALDYYFRIGEILEFDFLNSSLDSLLSHLGYSKPLDQKGVSTVTGLLAQDLEELDSFLLMPRNEIEFEALNSAVSDIEGFASQFKLDDFQNDRILVSRFFAPKIATYYYSVDSGKADSPIVAGDIVPGWRKLVRLKPRLGSDADRVGKIEHIYLLFNFKKQDASVDPFEGNESGNNQIIIVPKEQSVGDRIFFGVYQKKSLGYPIGSFLQADFDLPGHVGLKVVGATDSQYYVPRACAECHGHSGISPASIPLNGRPVDAASFEPVNDFGTGIYPFAKPNYLDTDQWYDWMEIDFPQVAGSSNDVVFDGGKNVGSIEYARAFQVIRKLNEGISAESTAAELDSSKPTFQSLGARKWLDLHSSSDARAKYIDRSIGTTPWNAASTDETQLLGLLNNHCFRCHSSVKYSVFDRDAVEKRRTAIKGFLKLKLKDASGSPLPGYAMPQGRVLSETDRLAIIRLIDTVFP